ncbi:MAG TPA: glucose-6-phosphate dehydrogenase assembly protein OpcA [Thermoanaerobaculia bacterium]|nr:glucose-6-phosphate dehydrogenase assembly protein OpcA [Thermoanaerobaculia bacterium]
MAEAVKGPLPEQDVRVDVASIEKQLAELWRAEKSEKDGAITRAALWNVVAHTWSSQQHAHAAEVLAKASASVPQRTIVVEADPRGDAGIASWISANCHLIGGGRQVCSEEIAIVASGEQVHHVAPLVNALLLPDMPVAVWWLGDLPDAHHEYAETLLEPADRLIVDSSHFSGAPDLDLVLRIAEQTTTAPADLNWARIEEWRAATASLFDPPSMRNWLQAIRGVRVSSGGDASFGASSEGLLYVAWLTAQSGVEVQFELASAGGENGIRSIELRFEDGSLATVRRDHGSGAVIASAEGNETPSLDCVTRSLAHDTDDLIVRLLKRPEADRVYLKALKVARRLAA